MYELILKYALFIKRHVVQEEALYVLPTHIYYCSREKAENVDGIAPVQSRGALLVIDI